LWLCFLSLLIRNSPAGAAIAVPLSQELAEAYEVVGKELTAPVCSDSLSICQRSVVQALAYVRARNADPMSRFGRETSILLLI
jgi:AICAR transformylase/IMP cyclohydrolase PurH